MSLDPDPPPSQGVSEAGASIINAFQCGQRANGGAGAAQCRHSSMIGSASLTELLAIVRVRFAQDLHVRVLTPAPVDVEAHVTSKSKCNQKNDQKGQQPPQLPVGRVSA
jgi:hypothetical protein